MLCTVQCALGAGGVGSIAGLARADTDVGPRRPSMLIGEPNLFAYIALFLWVPVTLVAFMRLRPPLATMYCVISGVMFLPESIAVDPPMLPPMDKFSITAVWAFVGCLWKARERIIAARPLRRLDALFVLVVLGNLGTAWTNTDALVTGPVTRQALTLYDAFAGGVKDTLSLYLPFLLARAMLRTRQDLQDLMRALTIGGVIYASLALVEVRLSPQLHRWLYGYHQSEFSMTMRFGGYRPMIFMQHGLATAMFVLSAAVVAWSRWRADQIKAWIPLYLTGVLLLCKSTGAIVYAVFVVPVVMFTRRPRMRLAAGLAVMVLLFPLLRSTKVFPTDTLVEWAENISKERALSLWFRFDQEDQLLDRARERILFGWGPYSRNRVYDPETGEDLSVTDGDWMIQLGTRGLTGFIGLYGILALSVLLAFRSMPKVSVERDRILLAGLALASALQTVDLLPNGLFHFLPFFFAGAVAGLTEGLARSSRSRTAAKRASTRVRSGESELSTAVDGSRSAGGG